MCVFFSGMSTFTEWKKKEEEEGGIFIKAIMSIATLNHSSFYSPLIFLKKLFCKIEFSAVKAVEF